MRGKDRLISTLRGPSVPTSLKDTPVEARFGKGLRAQVPLGIDASLDALFFIQYQPPALAPILDAVLQPGDQFYDVGANVGMYSLWAARIVGDAGKVHAFEPVPYTASWLMAILRQNDITNVEIVQKAVSSRPADVVMNLMAGGMGQSYVDTVANGGAETVVVRSVSLDAYSADRPQPRLVKIDAEGHEPEVVTGMATLLDTAHPVVVFEAPDVVGRHDGSRITVERFNDHGYDVWSLTPSGLRPFDQRRFTHNLLAIHPRYHRVVQDRLRSTRFARNQTR